MSNPASTQPDPLQTQVDQLNNLRAMLELMKQLPVMTAELQAQNAKLEAMKTELQGIKAENVAMKAENINTRQQLELANKPVKSVWFKARIKYTDCHTSASTAADIDKHVITVMDTAETDVKTQFATWKADPANADRCKLIVAETLIPCDQEQFRPGGSNVLHAVGFVYLQVQYKDL